MNVRVGKTNWSVRVVGNLEDALKVAYGTHTPHEPNLVGYTDTAHRMIFIEDRRNAQELASTYFHELLHAACPELSERRAYHLERVLFRLLWKDGWRPDVLYRR